MEKVKHFFSKPIVHGFLIFSCSILFYVWFYHLFQLTSYLTLNGVWKTINYLDYKSGIRSIESGNVLYYNVVDVFKFFLGANSSKEYYILIIYINAFFAALLNGSIYLFAHLILKNTWRSFLWMCLHALNPGVFFLAVSSEDIFPAYTLYVWMLFAFYFYVQKQKRMYLLLVSTCLAFTFFFHWTAGVPALLSLVLYLTWENRLNIREAFKSLTIVFSTLFFLFFIVSLYLDCSFLKIWYPGKSMDSMWVSGISFEKILLVVLNTVSYFFTTFRLNVLTLNTIIFGLIVLFLSCYFFLKFLKINNSKNKSFNQLMILSFGVFIIGTGMNLIEQASDPQFFLQTQFVFFLLIFYWIIEFKTVIISVFLSFFIVNICIVSSFFKDLDTKSNQNIKFVEEKVSCKNILFISNGFNPFISWSKLMWGNDVSVSHIYMPGENQSEATESDLYYFNKMKDSIESFVKQEYQVIVLDFLERSPAELGAKFLGYDFTQKMNLIQTYLKTNYALQKIEGTQDYPIYLLTPKADE